MVKHRLISTKHWLIFSWGFLCLFFFLSLLLFLFSLLSFFCLFSTFFTDILYFNNTTVILSTYFFDQLMGSWYLPRWPSQNSVDIESFWKLKKELVSWWNAKKSQNFYVSSYANVDMNQSGKLFWAAIPYTWESVVDAASMQVREAVNPMHNRCCTNLVGYIGKALENKHFQCF